MNKSQERSNASSSFATRRGNPDAASSAYPASSMGGMNLVPCSRYRDGRTPCMTPRVIELGDASDRSCFNGQDR